MKHVVNQNTNYIYTQSCPIPSQHSPVQPQPASDLIPRQRLHSRSAPMQPLAPSPSRSPHSLCTSPRGHPVSDQNIAIATHLRSPVAALRTRGSFTHAPVADRTTQKRTVHAHIHRQPTRLDPWFMRVHAPEPNTHARATCCSAPYSLYRILYVIRPVHCT